MGDLPTGTVTFLFTDVEGSTRLLHELRERYGDVLEAQRRLLRAAFEKAGGREIDTQGDAFFVAFERASDAVAAATDAQQALAAHAWPEGAEVRVRMGIHTGEPSVGAEGYIGVDVHRGARICAAAHGGQVVLSEPARALLDEGVALQDLGEHRLKDLTLPQRLFQLLIRGGRSEFPPLKTLENRPTNLPIQPTPFIGRDREIEAACALLRRADVRMLTLTGAGGTGKTRLALQVAADVLDEFGDGAFVVDLAALSDPALVLPSVAQTLGLREAEGEPIEETLKRYLEDRELLLLLDNFEHVVEAGPSLADLVATCATVKVLATSRAPLHLASEHEYAVPPLRQAEAIALFSERAQAARMDFALTDDDAPIVSEICARLDGIPLAIELAAARAKLFSPAALLARLGQRLTVLTGGARDSPARQQTLRATIDWSYNLLDEAEQALFAELAVFVGGFTLEAAEAVCGLELDMLASLVDKSLLRREDTRGGEPRFAMLETIREYALERLAARADAADVARRHCEHFVGLAEQAERHFRGPEQEAWQDRLEADLENLRSALTWSSEGGEHGLELRLATSLAPFWEASVYVREGRRRLEEALSRSGALPVPLRAKAHFATARLAGLVQGDVRRQNELLEESLSLFREADDAKGVAHSLSLLGVGVAMAGDPERGTSLGEEGVSLARRLGDDWLVAMTLNNLGNVALAQGDHGYAKRLWEESLELRRPYGDKQGTASTLINLGELALGEGDVERAVAVTEEGRAIASEVGYLPFVAAALSNLGLAALHRGDTDSATSYFQESLPLCRESGDPQVTAACLAGLAGVAAEGGERERAARLWAAAQALHEAEGNAPPSSLAFVRERVSAALSEVGEQATAKLRDEGRAMTVDEAISYALTTTPDTERDRT